MYVGPLDRVSDQATSDCKGIIDRAMDITKLPTLDLRNRDDWDWNLGYGKPLSYCKKKLLE